MLSTPLGSRGMSPSPPVEASTASLETAQAADADSSDDQQQQGDHCDDRVPEGELQQRPQQQHQELLLPQD
jgi:hypothetical protein